MAGGAEHSKLFPFGRGTPLKVNPKLNVLPFY